MIESMIQIGSIDKLSDLAQKLPEIHYRKISATMFDDEQISRSGEMRVCLVLTMRICSQT